MASSDSMKGFIKINYSLSAPIEECFKIIAPILVAASVFISIYSLIQAERWIKIPFPGFLLYRNLTVAEISLYNWTGYKAGLKYYDRILALEGKRVSSADEVYSIVASKPIGALVNYTVSRNNRSVDIAIPTMRFELSDFLLIFCVVYIVGIVFQIIGFLVYYLKPNLDSSKVFLMFCFSMGFWFTSIFDTQSTYSLYNIPFLGLLFAPAFVIHLASVFPSKRKFPALILFSYLLSFVLSILHIVCFSSQHIWASIERLFWLYVFFGALVFLISTVITYLKSKIALDKQRAQVVLLGSCIGFFLPGLGAAIVVLFGRSNLNNLAIPVIFFPLSIAYAIVKHNLFDIDVIIKKALLYSVLTGVLGGIFILMVIAFNVVFASYGGWRNPVLLIIITVFLVITLNPLKDRIQNLIDLTFFRKRYDYHRTIEEISSAMTSLLNLDEIATKIITTIERTMFLNSVSIILLDENSGNYEVYATSGVANGISRKVIKENSRLVALLEKYKKEIFREDLIAGEKYIEYRDELMEVFNDFNAALFIPLLFKEQLIGILSLGGKRSGLLYTSEDIRLLKTLANQSAIAIENAIAYRMVEDYAKKLERANKELKETQSQLIQSEKMSAIGQLAAGIAHEIRNPLNIIEGARYYLSQVINGEDSAAGEYLDYIKHEIERTNHLINNLLRFSKAEPPHFELLDINNVLENTLVLVRKQLSDNHIKLITNFEVDIPNIVGDPNQLWQVFINIIINAIQAMPAGGELRIDTSLASVNSGCVLIKFTDTGIGIDKEDIPKIFNPFFTKKDTGTGLGLSISYRIVEEHGGKILVSSEKGKGTTFIVELPIRHSDSIGVEDDGEQKSLSS